MKKKKMIKNAPLLDSECEKTENSKTKKLHYCHYENCDRAFKSASYLEEHLDSHTENILFVCKWRDCGKHFSLKTTFYKHIQLHTEQKNYVCDSCGYKFWSKCRLIRHIKNRDKKKTKH